MKTIEVQKMTRELCHELYKGWSNDASIYTDMSLFKPYSYEKAAVDRYFDSKNETSRILFAIMLEDRPIGELQLKRIDREKAECTCGCCQEEYPKPARSGKGGLSPNRRR